MAVVPQHQVFGDRHARHDSHAHPVLGDVRHACPVHRARGQIGNVPSQHGDAAAGGRAQPCHHLHQLALAVSCHAGDAQDLSPAHGEGDPPQSLETTVVLGHKILNDHRLAVGGAGVLADPELHVPADHHARQRAPVGLGDRQRGHSPTLAHDGHAVGDLGDLIQLVRDEDHRVALQLHPAQHLEQPSCLLRGEHARGLVQNENPRPPDQRLYDLNALLLARRELPDERAGIYRQAVPVGQLPYLRLDLPGRGDEAHPWQPKRDVLGDGVPADQEEVLGDHADAK